MKQSFETHECKSSNHFRNKIKKNKLNCIPLGSNKPFTGTMGTEIMVRCKPERR